MWKLVSLWLIISLSQTLAFRTGIRISSPSSSGLVHQSTGPIRPFHRPLYHPSNGDKTPNTTRPLAAFPLADSKEPIKIVDTINPQIATASMYGFGLTSLVSLACFSALSLPRPASAAVAVTIPRQVSQQLMAIGGGIHQGREGSIIRMKRQQEQDLYSTSNADNIIDKATASTRSKEAISTTAVRVALEGDEEQALVLEQQNPFEGAWREYNDLLRRKPLLTKALTSWFGFSIGDLLAQKLIDKKEKINIKRFLKLSSFGLLIHGPLGHYFYSYLDQQIPGREVINVATKVAIDQLVANPMFGIIFFGYLGLVEGQDLQGIKKRISNDPWNQIRGIQKRINNDLWNQIKGSWSVWPIAHTVNFAFIPSEQRLLYINMIQIGYNIFLSFLADKSTTSSSSGSNAAAAAAVKVVSVRPDSISKKGMKMP